MSQAFRIFLFALLVVAAASQSFAAKRVALVIGNSAYAHTSALETPHNEAKDMAAALRRLGFDASEGSEVEEKTERFCPLECCARYQAESEGCVKKNCPAGELLTSAGQCIARASPADMTESTSRKVAQAAARTRRPAANRRPPPRRVRNPPRRRAPPRRPTRFQERDSFCTPEHNAEFLRCK